MLSLFSFNYYKSFLLSINEKLKPKILNKKLNNVLTIGSIMQSKVNLRLRSAESNPSNNTGNYNVYKDQTLYSVQIFFLSFFFYKAFY